MQIRPIKQNRYCRACRKLLKRETKIIYIKNYPQSVILCLPCGKKISELISEEDFKDNI